MNKFFIIVLSIISSCVFAAQVEDHIIHSIEKATVACDPFPYLVVDNVFPDAYYQEALRLFPSKKIVDGNPVRVAVFFSPNSDDFQEFTDEQKEFWSEFDRVVNDVLYPEIVKKFGDLYMKKFDLPIYEDKIPYIKDNFTATYDRNANRVLFDRESYGINPHVDQLLIYLNVLLYFAEDDSMASYGTYAIGCDKKSHGVSYLTQNDFVKSETLVEYLPNRLCVMMQTPVSWHKVQQHWFDKDRKLMLNSITVDQNFMESIDDDIIGR